MYLHVFLDFNLNIAPIDICVVAQIVFRVCGRGFIFEKIRKIRF
jgi:hypothetical protein